MFAVLRYTCTYVRRAATYVRTLHGVHLTPCARQDCALNSTERLMSPMWRGKTTGFAVYIINIQYRFVAFAAGASTCRCLAPAAACWGRVAGANCCRCCRRCCRCRHCCLSLPQSPTTTRQRTELGDAPVSPDPDHQRARHCQTHHLLLHARLRVGQPQTARTADWPPVGA